MRRIFHGNRKSRKIGLSFDDGFSPEEEKLICALNKAEMKATFFCIYEKVFTFQQEDPEGFDRILELLEQGQHEIAIHAWGCKKPSLIQRFKGVEDWQIGASQRGLFLLTGHLPILDRPHCSIGFRKRGIDTIIGIHQLGNDFVTRKFLRQLYLLAFKVSRPGDIICGHSSKDDLTNFGLADQIADVVPDIAKILKDRGLEATTISEALK